MTLSERLSRAAALWLALGLAAPLLPAPLWAQDSDIAPDPDAPAHAPDPDQDPAGLVLRDGFDGSGFAPEGGRYYRHNFEQEAGTMRFQSQIVRAGKGALELSVVPHCPADRKNCSERAEIWGDTALRVPYDEGVWSAFSMRFGDPVPRDDHRYVMAQWKREILPGADGDYSPFVALRLRSGVMFATIETDYLDPGEGAPCPRPGSARRAGPRSGCARRRIRCAF